jgi:hypothetical protein
VANVLQSWLVECPIRSRKRLQPGWVSFCTELFSAGPWVAWTMGEGTPHLRQLSVRLAALPDEAKGIIRE